MSGLNPSGLGRARRFSRAEGESISTESIGIEEAESGESVTIAAENGQLGVLLE